MNTKKKSDLTAYVGKAFDKRALQNNNLQSCSVFRDHKMEYLLPSLRKSLPAFESLKVTSYIDTRKICNILILMMSYDITTQQVEESDTNRRHKVLR